MKVLKYSTDNLTCYMAKNSLGQEHYQIYENGKNDKPVAIYIDKNDMRLSNDDIPEDVSKYKYFNELVNIVNFLYDL